MHWSRNILILILIQRRSDIYKIQSLIYLKYTIWLYMSNIWIIYLKLVIYKSRFSGHWFSYTISFTAIPRVSRFSFLKTIRICPIPHLCWMLLINQQMPFKIIHYPYLCHFYKENKGVSVWLPQRQRYHNNIGDLKYKENTWPDQQ
jgi:hypothetical protein